MHIAGRGSHALYPYPRECHCSRSSIYPLDPGDRDHNGLRDLCEKRNSGCALGATMWLRSFPSLLCPGRRAIHGRRYTYLPSLGPFLACGSMRGMDFTKSGCEATECECSDGLGHGGLDVLALLLFLTFQQIHIWRDSITLWSYVMKGS